MLNSYSKSLKDFGLPAPPQDVLCMLQNRLLMEETNYNPDILLKERDSLIPRLNEDQKLIFDEITQAVHTNVQKLIFVYGHGGTGKIFLWKAIASALRFDKKIVLVVASSGIASLLLPSGRTAHSRFQIPDEAPTNDRRCFEALDSCLKDVLDNPNTLFGGKSIMPGGDFRQTLPPGITEAEKMRIDRFSTWLLDIGNGSIGDVDVTESTDTFRIELPTNLCIQDSDTAITELINFIYTP
ncbi:DNA helicase [Tanacetum coccineum]